MYKLYIHRGTQVAQRCLDESLQGEVCTKEPYSVNDTCNILLLFVQYYSYQTEVARYGKQPTKVLGAD